MVFHLPPHARLNGLMGELGRGRLQDFMPGLITSTDQVAVVFVKFGLSTI